MDPQLKGKLVFVTGSTSGIGAAIATEYARYGAIVLVNGRSEGSCDKAGDSIAADSGADRANLVSMPGDISNKDGANAIIEKIAAVEKERGIELYGLICNMGIFHVEAFEQISDDKWLEYYETNVMSNVRLARAYLPGMIKRNVGRIILISSETGIRPLPHMMAYSVSKASQINLARGLAELTKGTAVTVNSVLPGPTMTEGVRKYMVDFGKQHNIDSFEEAVARYFKEHEVTSLLQRFLEPKEVANAVVFLGSALGSGVNGHAQHVEGGLVRHI